MHDKIFDIARNNDCIMAITPDNAGTFISPIRNDLIKLNQQRNFYKQFQIWFDFVEAAKQITIGADFEMKFSFTKIGTAYNAYPYIFYPYQGTYSAGVYFNTTTSQPLRLQCFLFTTAAINMTIVLNQRYDFVIRRINNQISLFLNDRLVTTRSSNAAWLTTVYPLSSDSINIHELTLKVKDKTIFSYPNESERLGLVSKTSVITTGNTFDSCSIYTYPSKIVLPFDFRNRAVIDYSFAMRFRFNNIDSYSTALPILSQGFTAATGQKVMSLHGIRSSNYLRLYFSVGTNNIGLNSPPLYQGQWHDVAISFTPGVGTTRKALIYTNGVFTEQTLLTGMIYPNLNPTVDTLINTNAQLFADPTSLGNRYFKWQLNKFFVFNKSLTKEDMINIFN